MRRGAQAVRRKEVCAVRTMRARQPYGTRATVRQRRNQYEGCSAVV